MTKTAAPRESAAAAAAFSRYLAMGEERSLRGLAAELRRNVGKKHPSQRTIETWSSAFEWDRRAREHDRAAAAAAEAKLVKDRAAEIVRMRKKRMDLSVVLMDIATEAFINPKTGRRRPITRAAVVIDQDGNVIGENPVHPAETRAAAVILKLAMETQRLETGEATGRTEVTGADGGPIRQQFTVDMDDMGDIADFLERANALFDQTGGPRLLPHPDDADDISA